MALTSPIQLDGAAAAGGRCELRVGGTGSPRSGPLRTAAGRSGGRRSEAGCVRGCSATAAGRLPSRSPPAVRAGACRSGPDDGWPDSRGGATGFGSATAARVGAAEIGASTGLPAMSIRRSIRSSRCSSAASPVEAPGSSIRAHNNSSTSRGEVVPRMSTSPVCITSASRVRVAMPSRSAWPTIDASWSSGASISPLAAASGTALMITRSRSRCSRSAANRRGSCPASTTRSTAPNTEAPSPAASASTTSSSSAASVTPSRATALR